MSAGASGDGRAEPIVVCVQHPASPDLSRLNVPAARTLDLRSHPFREGVALRRARQAPPVPAALLEKAPVPDAAIRRTWAEVEALVTLDLPIEWLEAMPRLRFVQAYSAGLEQFPLEALAARGIRIASASGAGAPAIAEFVFGRLIEVFRNLREIESMQRAGAFHRPGGRTLAGHTIGIVGLGAIGSAVARLARAFDLRILATRRSAQPGDESPLVDALYPSSELDVLLAESDILVLCAPASPETADLIDGAALGRMKEGAVLCNVARGSLVDEPALAEALGAGHLGAAILDVTREEPLPADSPLWTAPRLHLSPHCSIPPDAYDARLLDLFAENLVRYAAGDALRNEVAVAADGRA